MTGVVLTVVGFVLAVVGLGGVASASYRATWRSLPTLFASVSAWVLGTIMLRQGLVALGVVV